MSVKHIYIYYYIKFVIFTDCNQAAQKYQNMVTITNVKLLSNVKIIKNKQLSDAEAVELGADMIAEVMIWSAAAFQVIGVYYWSLAEKQEKSQTLNAKFQSIEDNYNQLKYKFDILEHEILSIQSYIAIHNDDENDNDTEQN